MTITLFHNPRCSKSRQTLALLNENGVEPTIVEYLKTPPSEAQLAEILSKLEMHPRDLMRKKEVEYKESGANDESLSEAALISLMVANPKLIERPIAITETKAVIGRPPENVLDLV